jgi:mannose-6-phosphate isomerase
MPTELAAVRAVLKPWGVRDLQPWSSLDASGEAVGELWFERSGEHAHSPALLLKLLFTSEPLSIQVHPDDTFARAMGMPNGKSEAWYILSAEPDARIGVGLKHRITPQQLRASIQDGSIEELVDWRAVAKDDVIYIPAGTIHAIGAGIVLAEIQQHSDATFRLFDFGRQRELHEDNGVAVAHPWPLRAPRHPTRLSTGRTVLIASRHFVLERLELPENSSWALLAASEAWILVLEGHAAIGLTAASIGQAVFVAGGRSSIEVGANGLSALIAYPASRPIDSLLQVLGEQPGSPVNLATPALPQFAGPARTQSPAEAQT